MKIFFLRHATRPFTLGDVSLNDKGVKQARELSFNKELLTVKTILSSPKRRAQMTVQPLADKLNISLRTIESLDQMKSGESDEDFARRIQSVLEKIAETSWPSPLLICTHSDWLSTLMQILPTDDSSLNYHLFECAEFMSFELQDQIWYKK